MTTVNNIVAKTDLKAPLLGGDDIAYGDDAIQPDFQHKEAKIDTGSNLIDMGSLSSYSSFFIRAFHFSVFHKIIPFFIR
jgi:hypothetical protein